MAGEGGEGLSGEEPGGSPGKIGRFDHVAQAGCLGLSAGSALRRQFAGVESASAGRDQLA